MFAIFILYYRLYNLDLQSKYGNYSVYQKYLIDIDFDIIDLSDY